LWELPGIIILRLCGEIRILSGNQVEIVWKPEVCGRGGPFFDLGMITLDGVFSALKN